MRTCKNCMYFKDRGGIPGVLDAFLDFTGECRIRSPQQQVQFVVPGSFLEEDGSISSMTYTGSFPLRQYNHLKIRVWFVAMVTCVLITLFVFKGLYF